MFQFQVSFAPFAFRILQNRKGESFIVVRTPGNQQRLQELTVRLHITPCKTTTCPLEKLDITCLEYRHESGFTPLI